MNGSPNLAVCAATLMVGCGGNSPTAPTQQARTTGTLTGTITYIGPPARLRLRGPLPLARVEVIDGAGAGASAVADDCGRYRLEGLPGGPVTLSVSKTSYTSAVTSSTIKGGQTTTLDARLDFDAYPKQATVPLWTISGVVTDAGNGVPVDLALVTAFERTTDLPYDAKQTDGLGHFRVLVAVQPIVGMNTLAVYKEGYVMQRVPLPESIGAGDTVINVAMQRGTAVPCTYP